MSLLDLMILSFGLAMDASCVAVSDVMAYPKESLQRLLVVPVTFGLFHGLMPVLGYFIGGVAAEFIEDYAGIIALVVLAIIGGNMVREGVKATLSCDTPNACKGVPHLTMGIVFAQAFAVAIDAFAVGVSLRALNVNLFVAGSVITVVTFLACCVALALGLKPGKAFGHKAMIVGGIVVVAMGIRLFLA